jgi:phosphatidylserine decarboxylase
MNLREELSFLLTNRVPRRWLTLLMGRLSPLEVPVLSPAAIGLWKMFSDLDLSEAKKSRFVSLQDCFTRELKPGARPVAQDPATLVSPCDGIVGACGTIDRGTVLQAKGFPYTLIELLNDASFAKVFEGGQYVTLRITPTMYHRFHAPHDLEVQHVTYVSGDTWNVYPIALRKVHRLFCRNERAILRCRLASTGTPIALVPVAAILVASIRLHCADVLLHLKYPGPNEIPCSARYEKGQEMGWFQHGSTIIALVPKGVSLSEGIAEGMRIRVGEPLFREAT